MIPLTTAHRELVALERAQLLARLERTRSQREQATQTNCNHSRAGRRAGTNSFRRLTGAMLVRTGHLVAGGEWADCPPARSTTAARPATATR